MCRGVTPPVLASATSTPARRGSPTASPGAAHGPQIVARANSARASAPPSNASDRQGLRLKRFDARARSIVCFLSCRSKTISDAVKTVRALEIAGFRFGKVLEAVPEDFLPPRFELIAMLRS